MHFSDNDLRELLETPEGTEASWIRAKNLEGHLADCAQCQQRLEALVGEGAWLAKIATAVDEAVDKEKISLGLSTWQDQDQVGFVELSLRNQTLVELPATSIRQEFQRYDFLEPPQRSGLLGHLGRYDVEQSLGTGGFGVVFKAWDTELKRMVAIKVLSPFFSQNEEARIRFLREAKAIATIIHKHVVEIYDVVMQNDVCYFVTEYIAGESLRQRIDREGPLFHREALRVAIQIASGLSEVHGQGITHRDLKPSNILLEEGACGRVLISDFGLAQMPDDEAITATGTVIGTPLFMSPEQIEGQFVDFRSDLFSLGSLIYYMLTGKSPFHAPSVVAILNNVCRQPYPCLFERNVDVPERLSLLVGQLLEKDPVERCDNINQVSETLTSILEDFKNGRTRPVLPDSKRWTGLWLKIKRMLIGVALFSTVIVSGTPYPAVSHRDRTRSFHFDNAKDCSYDDEQLAGYHIVSLVTEIDWSANEWKQLNLTSRQLAEIEEIGHEAFQNQALILEPIERAFCGRGILEKHALYDTYGLWPSDLFCDYDKEILGRLMHQKQKYNTEFFQLLSSEQQQTLLEYFLPSELQHVGFFASLKCGMVANHLLQSESERQVIADSCSKFHSEILSGLDEICLHDCHEITQELLAVLGDLGGSKVNFVKFVGNIQPRSVEATKHDIFTYLLGIQEEGFEQDVGLGDSLPKTHGRSDAVLMYCANQLENKLTSEQMDAVAEWCFKHSGKLDDDPIGVYFEIWDELDEIVGTAQKEELVKLFLATEIELYGPIMAIWHGAYLRSFLNRKQRRAIRDIENRLSNEKMREVQDLLNEVFPDVRREVLDGLNPHARKILKEATEDLQCQVFRACGTLNPFIQYIRE